MLVVAMNEIWCINKSLLIAGGAQGHGTEELGGKRAPTNMDGDLLPSVSGLTPLPPPADADGRDRACDPVVGQAISVAIVAARGGEK